MAKTTYYQEEHRCDKETQIAVMDENIKNMKEKVDEIHKFLVGRDGLITDFNQFKGGVRVANWLVGIGFAVVGLFIAFKK